MKKTIITLLALGSVAMGATSLTLDDAIYESSSGGSITLDPTLSEFTVVATLDIEALYSVIKVGAPKSTYSLINCVGTASGGNASIGLGTNFSSAGTSSIKTSGLYASWQGADPKYGVGMNTGVTGMESEDFWKDAVGAAVTLSYKYSTGTVATLSVYRSDDTVTSYGGTYAGDLKASQATYTQVTLNDTFVEKSYVFNTSADADNAKKLSEAAAIPEPTTATLSLLALAGLAARRRRR